MARMITRRPGLREEVFGVRTGRPSQSFHNPFIFTQIVYTICASTTNGTGQENEANIAAGRLGFEAVEGFEWETAVIESSNRRGETRWAATGYIGDRLHRVVYTRRGDRIRIISLRRASAKKMRDYARA